VQCEPRCRTVTEPVVTTPPPAEPTATTVEATAETQVVGRRGRVRVTVSPHASGTVTLALNGKVVAQAEHTSGATHVTVPAKALPVGRHTLVVTYSGSATHAAAQSTVALDVVKQEPRLTLRAPKKVTSGKAVDLTARLRTVGKVGSGKVRFVLTRAGRTKVKRIVTARLKQHQANASVRLQMSGSWSVKAIYLGDSETTRATKRANLRVS